MGFTIQDLMILSQERYKMEFIAGKNGWSNSISWAHMLEDPTSMQHFVGKELVVTTGLGFGTEEKLEYLVREMVHHSASGLVINTGYYLMDVPQKLIELCDSYDLPLLTVPWEIAIADMIKDIGIRIFFQGTADEEITNAFITAIRKPSDVESYRNDLLAHYDVEGDFQVTIIAMDGLAEMDTVDRKKLSYRLQIYMENITHNGSFMYYDGDFVLITNDVSDSELDEIVTGFVTKVKLRMTDEEIHVGVGSMVQGIENLHKSYERAKSAASYAKSKDRNCVSFDEMGLYRLFYSVPDQQLLSEMVEQTLRPLTEYDEKHESNYVDTLEWYLRCNGSIQEVSDAMYTHRNTVIYRMNNIKKILDCKLETMEERMPYIFAYFIKKMS